MKGKRIKKFIALFMAAMMLGSVAGCGKKESTKSETIIQDAKEMVYEESELMIEEVEGEIADISIHDGKMYLIAIRVPEVDFENMTDEELDAYAETMLELSVTRLYSANIDGTEVQEIACLDTENNQMIEHMDVTKDGSVVFLASGYDMEGNTSSYQILKTDSQGKELIRKDISDLLKETDESYVSDMMVDEKGQLVVVMSDSVYIIDENLKSAEEVKPKEETFLRGVAKTKDGKIVCAVSSRTDEKPTSKLQILDAGKKKWGESYELDTEMISGMMNGLEYDVYYTDNSGIYGYNITDKKSIKLLDYVASNITSDMNYGVMPLAKEQFIGLAFEGGYESVLTVYNKVDPSEIVDKAVIRVAALGVDDVVKRQAIAFNKTNKEYQIEFVDYFKEMDPVAKLNADIAAGNSPDIFCLGDVSYEQYIAKGMFEDLTPYLEKDEELRVEDFIPSVYEAMKSEDGKLYYLATSFGISTIVGKTSDVGDEMGWTFDDLKAVLEKKGDGVRPFYSEDKMGILYTLLSNGLHDFVDWNSGECEFDSQDFKDILEICNKGIEGEMEYDEDGQSMESLIQEGKVLFSEGGVSFDEIQIYPNMFGEDITYIGYPSEDKSGSYFRFNNQMAIYSKSEVKEGAWAFLRTLMTKEFQGNQNDTYNTPTRQDCMDMLIKAKMTTEAYTDEFGQEITPQNGSIVWNDFEVELKPFTQEEVDEYLNLVNNTKKVSSYDDVMFHIVAEEAKAYFAGQKSLDETAKIIQNRITTYVNENK